jgi:hypothetical protein
VPVNGIAAAACFILLGALIAIVASRGVSSYHDGVRPLLPEYRRGEIAGPDLSRRAWSMSAGFVAWFSVPFTIVTGVLTSHLLFLPAECLGLLRQSRAIAALSGAVCGLGAWVVMAVFRLAIPALPAVVSGHLALIASPMRYVLPLFPILAAFYQWGVRAALGVGAAAGAVTIGASYTTALPGSLTASGAGLVAGTAVIVAAALRHRVSDAAPVPPFLQDNLRRLRRTALPALAVIGALCGAVAQAGLLAGEPAAALLVAFGSRWDAAAVGLFSAVAFAPMVTRSAATSGAYSTQGFPDWVLSAGLLSGSPLIGAAAGSATIAAELLAAPFTLRLLHHCPDIAELGSAMRQALVVIIDLAVLTGSVMAATAIAPSIGAVAVLGLFFWNEASQRRVMPVAVGPIGVIATAVVAAVFQMKG